jgi:hypothetical protein
VDGKVEDKGVERVQSGETVVGSRRESGQDEEEEITQDNKSGVTVVVIERER